MQFYYRHNYYHYYFLIDVLSLVFPLPFSWKKKTNIPPKFRRRCIHLLHYLLSSVKLFASISLRVKDLGRKILWNHTFDMPIYYFIMDQTTYNVFFYFIIIVIFFFFLRHRRPHRSRQMLDKFGNSLPKRTKESSLEILSLHTISLYTHRRSICINFYVKTTSNVILHQCFDSSTHIRYLCISGKSYLDYR